MPGFLKNISSTEIIILIVILFVLFGSKIFISLGRTGGETFKQIKKIKKSFSEAIEDDQKDDKK